MYDILLFNWRNKETETQTETAKKKKKNLYIIGKSIT